MANTLPDPTEGLVYTNPTTGRRLKFSQGCWKPIDYLPIDGSDSMQDTLLTPSQMINGNTLTASPPVENNINWDAWRGYESPKEDQPWETVIYSKEKRMFVATAGHDVEASNKMMYSYDGINWTGASVPDNRYVAHSWYRDIAYGSGRFVAVGHGSSGYNHSMWSDDGINWTHQDRYNDPNYIPGSQWAGITFGDGKFVAIGRGSGGSVVYSEDGISWTVAETYDGNRQNVWTGITYAKDKGLFVAIRQGGNNDYPAEEDLFMYSYDAINWTGTPSPNNSMTWSDIVYSEEKGLFVCVGSRGYSSYDRGKIGYSEDGINWTRVDVPVECKMQRYYSVAYGAGYFVAISGQTGMGFDDEGYDKILYSSDGIDWKIGKTYAENYTDLTEWRDIAYGQNKFVSVGRRKSEHESVKSITVLDTLAQSSKTITDDEIEDGWNMYPPSHENYWHAVAYGANKFTAVGRGPTGKERGMYSQDGKNWIRTPSSGLGRCDRWEDVSFGEGKFVAVGSAGDDRAAYSFDGVYWTPAVTAGNWNWKAVTYGKVNGIGRWVSVAEAGTDRVQWSSDGYNWQGPHSHGGGGINTGTQWQDITFGNDVFVAVGKSTNRISYSSDGIDWTDTTVPSKQWRGVTFSKDHERFVAVAYETDGTGIFWSDDGIDWTQVDEGPKGTANAWGSVAYGRGIFMAIGSQSANTAYSRDGINWKYFYDQNHGSWYDIAYGDGKFVSVANGSSRDNVKVMTVDPDGDQEIQQLYFNSDPVIVDQSWEATAKSLTDTFISKASTVRYHRDSMPELPMGDSYDYPSGAIWYQPSSNNAYFYNDSDNTWVQL